MELHWPNHSAKLPSCYITSVSIINGKNTTFYYIIDYIIVLSFVFGISDCISTCPFIFRTKEENFTIVCMIPMNIKILPGTTAYFQFITVPGGQIVIRDKRLSFTFLENPSNLQIRPLGPSGFVRSVFCSNHKILLKHLRAWNVFCKLTLVNKLSLSIVDIFNRKTTLFYSPSIFKFQTKMFLNMLNEVQYIPYVIN